MFIELTDHLRCPREHAEAFVVLLPARMSGRDVVAGHLGCPVCGWNTAWDDDTPLFGDAWTSAGTPPFDAVAAVAMLGVDGPGGWVALGGNAGTLAAELAALLPGVSLVSINPPLEAFDVAQLSVLRGRSWPLKMHSMRGVILGNDAEMWNAAAVASTLPGLRCIGSGSAPGGVTVLAAADGIWVATHR